MPVSPSLPPPPGFPKIRALPIIPALRPFMTHFIASPLRKNFPGDLRIYVMDHRRNFRLGTGGKYRSDKTPDRPERST
jgi:hypothetical protein